MGDAQCAASPLALWQKAVCTFSARPAILLAGNEFISFAKLDAVSDTLASALCAHGIKPGETVLVDARRGPIWPTLILGIWKAGAVYAPVAGLDPVLRNHIVSCSGARFALGDASDGQDVHSCIRRLAGHAVPSPVIRPEHAYVMPTSGSMGEPKLALVTHASSAKILSGLCAAIGMMPGERAMHSAAFTFSSSLRQLFVPLLSGAAVFILPGTDGFSPAALLDEAAGRTITSLDLTPSHLAAVVRYLEAEPQTARPAALRRLLVASETFTPALLKRWREAIGVSHGVFHLYGQTETGGAVSALQLPERLEPDAAYLPLAMPFAPFAARFRPLDDENDHIGELCLAGFSPHDGLFDAAKLDRCAFDPVSGLYATGDLFERRPDGLLIHRGRKDAQIKLSGKRIDAGPLEQGLLRISGIAGAFAAALRRPGGDGTILGLALVAQAGTARPDDGHILATALPEHARLSLPIKLFWFEALPTNRSGKLDRAALTQAMQDSLAKDALDIAAAVDDTKADPLMMIWRRHTLFSAQNGVEPALSDAEPIEDQDFFALGGDSLSMIALLADVSRAFGLRIMPATFHKQPTLGGLRRLLAEHQAKAGERTPKPEPQPEQAVLSWIDMSGGSKASFEPCPATAFQHGLWVAERIRAARPSPYWLPITIDIPAVLEQGRVLAAYRACLRQFDMLRVAFRAQDEDRLILLPDSLDPEHAALSDWKDADADPDFGLDDIIKFKAAMHMAARIEADRSRLALRIHHSVADRPSLDTILTSLCRFYEDAGKRGPTTQPALALLTQPKSMAAIEAAKDYWQKHLPADPERRGRPSSPLHIMRIGRVVPADTRAGPAAGATRHAVFAQAYRQALAKAGCVLPDLIGIDIDTRPAGTSRALVGPFVNSLPLVLPLETGDGEDIKRVTAAIAALLPHAALSLGELFQRRPCPTGEPRQPFFLHKLVYQKSAYSSLHFGGVAASLTQLPLGIAENSTTLFIRDTQGQTTLELAYDIGMVSSEKAQGMLEAIAACC